MKRRNLLKLILEKDEDFVADVTVRDPDTKLPIDISTATFTAAFNKSIDTTTGGTAITISLVGTGIFRMTIPKATINALDIRSTYFINVFMLLSSYQYKLINGEFTVAGRALSP